MNKTPRYIVKYDRPGRYFVWDTVPDSMVAIHSTISDASLWANSLNESEEEDPSEDWTPESWAEDEDPTAGFMIPQDR